MCSPWPPNPLGVTTPHLITSTRQRPKRAHGPETSDDEATHTLSLPAPWFGQVGAKLYLTHRHCSEDSGTHTALPPLPWGPDSQEPSAPTPCFTSLVCTNSSPQFPGSSGVQLGDLRPPDLVPQDCSRQRDRDTEPGSTGKNSGVTLSNSLTHIWRNRGTGPVPAEPHSPAA